MPKISLKKNGDASVILNSIKRKIQGNKKVKIGFPEGSNNLDIAVYNEFGTKNMPARPFVRTAFQSYKNDLSQSIKNEAKSIMDGSNTMDRSLNRLGNKGVGLIQKNMTDIKTPPNAQSTIDQKGSSNPLIDTGQTRSSVTYKVE